MSVTDLIIEYIKTDFTVEYVRHVIEPPNTESAERLKSYLRHFIPKVYGLSERLVEWAWAKIDWEAVCKSVNDSKEGVEG